MSFEVCKVIQPGDTVVFDPSSLNPEWWNKQTEEYLKKCYGYLGYGTEEQMMFTFLCEMSPQVGHCVLVEIGSGRVVTMVHISNLRKLTEDEC